MLFTTKSLGLLVALPLSLAYPTTESLTRRFVGGQCGLHVTQFQKNENGVGGSYQYDIRIFDAIQDTIGGVNRLEIPDVQTRSVDSQLPYTVEITSGLLDADPITFRWDGNE
ncbi:MAG: hypothetical protein L6R39_000399 [Caloplaca ligustica]|nr:MAG: hypothetical protein L6R39_000399 [Caloplaca ligustica]